MSSPATPERRTVHYLGRVQGVGFRYTTRRLAANHAVTGYVQNLPDSRVKLIVEGTAREIDSLLKAIATTMAGNIVETQIDRSAANGEFEEFGIRF